MSAEYAMQQIGKLLDDYTDGDARPLVTLLRIAHVTGSYEAGQA